MPFPLVIVPVIIIV